MSESKPNKKERRLAARAAKASAGSLMDAATSSMISDPTMPTPTTTGRKRVSAKSSLPAMPKAKGTKKSGKKSPRPTVECACGCKGATKSTWVPGHDARAHGWALRVHRKLIKLSEVPPEEQPGCKFMLKRLVEKGAPTDTTTSMPKPKVASKAVSKATKVKAKAAKLVAKVKAATAEPKPRTRPKLVQPAPAPEPVVTTEELQQVGEGEVEVITDVPTAVASGE